MTTETVISTRPYDPAVIGGGQIWLPRDDRRICACGRPAAGFCRQPVRAVVRTHVWDVEEGARVFREVPRRHRMSGSAVAIARVDWRPGLIVFRPRRGVLIRRPSNSFVFVERPAWCGRPCCELCGRDSGRGLTCELHWDAWEAT